MTSLKNIDGRLMYLPNNDEKSAVFVDFENLRLLHRIKDGAKDQELSRAVGLKKQRNIWNLSTLFR